MHIGNKKKDILVLGKGPTQGLDDTMLMTETKYFVNFRDQKRKFCLSLHYNGSNNFLFVNSTKIYQLKAKISETTPYPLCFRNISKDFAVNNMKKRRKKLLLNRYMHDFSTNYNIIDISNI